MGAAEFEAELSGVLRPLGYAVRPSPLSDIHDVDLILETTGGGAAEAVARASGGQAIRGQDPP